MTDCCYIVDEFVSGTSAGAVAGVYFVAAGSTSATESVTNSVTNVTYTDSISVTVT